MAASLTRAAVAGFFLVAAAVSTSPAAEQDPRLSPTVTVLGQKLALQVFGHNPDEDVAAQYLPAKETAERWTLMLAVRIFKEKRTPDQAVAQKEQDVKARTAKGDAMANAVSFAKGNLRVIDFVVSQPPIVEHSVMSFSTRADGRLVSLQLARRYYQPSSEADDGLRAFMGRIKTNRDKYVRELERLSPALLK